MFSSVFEPKNAVLSFEEKCILAGDFKDITYIFAKSRYLSVKLKKVFENRPSR